MSFSAKQLQALRRNLNSRYIRTRSVNGRELSYIEGWYAISEANRIFGFDAWNRETIESRWYLRVKIVDHSSQCIRLVCELRCKRMSQQSFEKAMGLAKAVVPRLEKYMTRR